MIILTVLLKKFDPVMSNTTMSKEEFLRLSTSKWKDHMRHSKQAPNVVEKIGRVQDPTCSKPNIYVQQQKHDLGPTEDKEVKRELLARKVGSKIDQLVSQLFEEKMSTGVSH